MSKRYGGLTRLLMVLLALSLIAAACGSDDDGGSSASGDGELEGEIFISGSSTVEPISRLNAELFMEQNPDVSITVEGPGTSDGFELFCEGETDISDASRPIDIEEEAPVCEENGVEYVELKVGIDGISVLTNPENTAVECLNFGDLYALLGPESEGFENWSDASELGEQVGGVAAPYPDAPLAVTAPGEESGTYDSFAELALEDIAIDMRDQPEDGPFVRPDYQASADDNVIIQGIAGSPSSLGWVGYSFYVQNQDQVRAIPIAAEDGSDCIEPNQESIQSAEYPISRFLYVYVNAQKAEDNPALAAFVDYYMSDEGLAAVTDPNVGYVALPSDDIETTRLTWENKETGTKEG
jgi:phosphate transport system substrate-binding protein